MRRPPCHRTGRRTAPGAVASPQWAGAAPQARSFSQIPQYGLGRHPTGRAGDAARGVGAGPRHVQALDRRPVPAQPAGRPQGTELVEGDVEVHRVGAGPSPLSLHQVGCPGEHAADARPEPRRPRLDHIERPLHELLPAGLPPSPHDRRGGRAGQVDGVVARWGERRVDGRRGERVEGKRIRQQAGLRRRPRPAQVVEAVDEALQPVPVARPGVRVGREAVGGHVDQCLDDVAPPGGGQLDAGRRRRGEGRAARAARSGG